VRPCRKPRLARDWPPRTRDRGTDVRVPVVSRRTGLWTKGRFGSGRYPVPRTLCPLPEPERGGSPGEARRALRRWEPSTARTLPECLLMTQTLAGLSHTTIGSRCASSPPLDGALEERPEGGTRTPGEPLDAGPHRTPGAARCPERRAAPKPTPDCPEPSIARRNQRYVRRPAASGRRCLVRPRSTLRPGASTGDTRSRRTDPETAPTSFRGADRPAREPRTATNLQRPLVLTCCRRTIGIARCGWPTRARSRHRPPTR